MHPLLSQLLKKRNIESVNELTPEEQADFDTWERTLSAEKLTVDDMKTFCERQISIIEGRWRDMKVRPERKAELIPHHTIYQLIIRAIEAPQDARKQLEQDLVQMIKE